MHKIVPAGNNKSTNNSEINLPLLAFSTLAGISAKFFLKLAKDFFIYFNLRLTGRCYNFFCGFFFQIVEGLGKVWIRFGDRGIK